MVIVLDILNNKLCVSGTTVQLQSLDSK